MNKDNPGFQINSFQMASIVVCNIIGLGIITMPRLIASEALQDGWIAVIIGGLVIIMALCVMNRVCQRFPDLTLIEMLNKVFGKYLGILLALIFICFNIVLAAMMVRFWSGIVSAYLLPKTPTTIIIAVFLLVVAYLSVEGLKNIGRICELSNILIAPLFLVIIVALPEADWLNLMPLGESGIQNILKASATTSLSYCGVIMYMVIYPFSTEKQKVLRANLIGVLNVVLLYVFIAAVAIMVFGPVDNQNIRWPTLDLMRIATFPVIERLDFFVLFFYQLIIYRITVLTIFNAGFSLAIIRGQKDHRYMIWAVLPLVYLIALIPEDAFAVAALSNWVGIAGILIDIIYPLLLWLGIYILIKKGNSNA